MACAVIAFAIPSGFVTYLSLFFLKAEEKIKLVLRLALLGEVPEVKYMRRI